MSTQRKDFAPFVEIPIYGVFHSLWSPYLVNRFDGICPFKYLYVGTWVKPQKVIRDVRRVLRSLVLVAIYPLTTASCWVPTRRRSGLRQELARSNLLADSGHLASSPNDLMGLKKEPRPA